VSDLALSLSVPCTLASLSQVRDFVRQQALAAGLDKQQIYKLGLAVDEIATNAISHGYEESETSGELALTAAVDATALHIFLEDTAPPFDPTTKATPDNLDQPLEQRAAGGLGVFLAIQNVDEFAYRYASGRNCYTFIMHRPAAVSTPEVAAVLAKVSLFSELPDEVLNEIVRLARVERWPRETLIFKKGDPGTKLYAILSGKVRVHDGQQLLAHLGQGEIFGEMAAIDTQPRSASVTADQDSLLLSLEQAQLLELMRRQPEISLGIVRALTLRFRGQVRDLREVRRRLGRVILPLDEALASESGAGELLERILVEAQQFCNADGGALLLRVDDNHLQSVIMRIDSLGIAVGGAHQEPAQRDLFPLVNEATGQANDHSVVTFAANAGRSVHIADVYQAVQSRFDDTRAADDRLGYRTVSCFVVPLKDYTGRVIGALRLVNAKDSQTGDVVAFDPLPQLVVESLASQAAIVLTMRDLTRSQQMLVKLESDLQTARDIQAGFLPDQLPQLEGWQIAAYFRPAREVAGDFYDAFMLKKQNLVWIVMADVVDKGVPAALFMALVRSLTRAFAQQHYSVNWADLLDQDNEKRVARGQGRRRIASAGTIALKNALTLTNKYVLDNHIDLNMFATMFVGMFDPRSGRLSYINAGHNPPHIIAADGSLKASLRPNGPAVGMISGFEYEIENAHLAPGDTLFTYTDGVTEARAADKSFFGDDRLEELLQRPYPSAAAMLDAVKQAVYTFMGDAPQFDDVTMVAVKREAEPATGGKDSPLDKLL
jgi:sigma-B regulation protein RsbU (phosphoserine phosphatase)